jgi:serine/threonine protein kinase
MYTLEQGQRFERYRILKTLGSGIAGVSYAVEDYRRQRTVTLKLIHPGARLPDAARRQFFRDMQTIGNLSHPMLTPLLNYGEVNGQLFVAHSYNPHGSLLSQQGRRWFNPPLPVATAFTYGLQLARALAYIHTSGCIHGSLTLSNIFTANPTTKEPQATDVTQLTISDIGHAIFVRRYGQPQNTQLPATMAPEQLYNQHNPASDQYAIAILLYFWLTGRLPFRGSPEEIKQQKLQEIFPALTTLNPEINHEQAQIIYQALKANPKARYATMNDFARSLDQALTSANNPSSSFTSDTKSATTVYTSKQQSAPQPDHADAYLTITSPYQDTPARFYITQEATTIGRAGASDVLLDRDEITSRHHALILYEHSQYLIYDQRSTCGVKVNTHTLAEEEGYKLSNGDQIYVGDYTLTFHTARPEIQTAHAETPINTVSMPVEQ